MAAPLVPTTGVRIAVRKQNPLAPPTPRPPKWENVLHDLLNRRHTKELGHLSKGLHAR